VRFRTENAATDADDARAEHAPPLPTSSRGVSLATSSPDDDEQRVGMKKSASAADVEEPPLEEAGYGYGV
jgi:hypothetical protein